MVIKFLPLILSLLLLSACEKENNSSSSILAFDETDQAREKIIEANGDLKQIRLRFQENEKRLLELNTAIREKEETKVKELCDKLINEIDLGSEAGREAINKIKVAREMNIHEDFKQYLGLKIECLEKYIEAYAQRREAAILLRNSYDPKNLDKRDKFLAEYKEKEEKFKEIFEEARKSSQLANELATESMRKKI